MTVAAATKPRLGFLGVGWIGRSRLDAIARSGAAEIAAVADPALDEVAGVRCVDTLDELLESHLDGVVIATPTALHAEQAVAALAHGAAVFCQKPLGLDAREARVVVDAARRADRLLDLDLSYRHTEAARALKTVVGDIGGVFAADLVFHNAYGPNKPWALDPALAGGGCVLDLGIHLVDLALWLLDFPRVASVESRLYAGGRPLRHGVRALEDFAVAELELETGAVVRLACSWRLHAGRECVLEAAFHGTDGTVALRNADGSFYDFVGELRRGTETEVLARPPDAWPGRAAVRWARRVATGERFDARAEEHVAVAAVVDRIYGRTQ